jgi:hypothetical protein
MEDLGSCHPERSEEAEFLISKQSEMLRFAQHDMMGTLSSACWAGNQPAFGNRDSHVC